MNSAMCHSYVDASNDGKEADKHLKVWQIVLASSFSLAITMGIGRFAFTPILPMMLKDRLITLGQGSHLASANLIGYLVGAIFCMVLPRVWSSAAIARWGLFTGVVLTAAMALPLPALWLPFRLLSGIATAFVLVHTSRWCFSSLSLLGKSSLSSLMFAGVGFGIAVPGLVCSALIQMRWTSEGAWLLFALQAGFMLAIVWRFFRPLPAVVAMARKRDDLLTGHIAGPNEMSLFAATYALSGLGYIITATFLPVIARSTLEQSVWLDLFWPVFGVASSIGSILAARIKAKSATRWVLAGCYAMQGAGVILVVILPTIEGFILGSLLAGVPFTMINYFALQDVERLRPEHSARYIGLFTALYGIGQFLGPLVAAKIIDNSNTLQSGFDVALGLAAGALFLGALLFGILEIIWPRNKL